MNTKEIKINCPEGFEVDKENSTFECIRFKPIKNKLPKTWEEFCKSHPIKEGYYIDSDSRISPYRRDSRSSENDRNLLPSKELAEAMLALCQLIQLRDCYNDGWTPDWTITNNKYNIIPHKNVIISAECNWSDNRILAFKTAELCDQFLENFRDLIEVAKPLL